MAESKKTFLVGFSGGADSTAALLRLLKTPGIEKKQITAVHFNHHLRAEESDNEAVNAAKFAAEYGVGFRLIDLNIPPGGNLEARARRARLDAWKLLCSEFDDPVVVTGHHLDDKIENLFIRIGRGSNSSGLTGLQLYSVVEGVTFFRPLLIYTRQEIEKFLRENGIYSWAVDSSNLTCEYSRNVLRNKILPELFELYPGGRKAVAATLANLEYDAAFLDGMAKDYYENDEERFQLIFWQRHHRAMTVRMLRLLCGELFGDDAPLTAAAVEQFENMARENRDGICELDGSRKLRFSGGVISALEATPEKVLWNWREKSSVRWGNWLFSVTEADRLPEKIPLFTACFDGGGLPDVLEIGAPENGEKMVPFGRHGAVKVKDLRIKRKIPAFPVNPVLRIPGGEVLWLPGIRHSGQFPAGQGRRIVIVSAKKSEEFC